MRSPLFGVLGHETFFEYFRFELDAEDESFSLKENSKFTGRVREYPSSKNEPAIPFGNARDQEVVKTESL